MRSKENISNDDAVSPVVAVVLMVAVTVIIAAILLYFGFDFTNILGGASPDAAVAIDEKLNTTNNGSYYDVIFTYNRDINSDKVLIRDSEAGAGANLSRTGSVAELVKPKGSTLVVIAVKDGERRVLYTHEVGD